MAREEFVNIDVWPVTPDYFRTMGTPLVKGRFFTERDSKESPLVAIISERLARRYFPNEDPIGKRLILGDSEDEDRNGQPDWREIVGVVGDVRIRLDAETGPAMYYPYWQWPWYFAHLVVRTTSDPMTLAARLRSEVRALNKDQPVYSIRTMEQVRDHSIAQPGFRTLLLSLFGAVALVLAAVGIYGVMAYSVTQRTHEIGIRMALGAQQKDVLKLVVRQGMVLTLIGVAIGLAAASGLTRVLSSFLFGVTATDPATFVGVSLLLAGVALLACYIPACKATKVDPMVALRYE